MTLRCSFCHGEAVPSFVCSDSNQCLSDEVFTYCRCKVCGYYFLSPVPENLGSYYPDVYYGVPEDLGDLEMLAEKDKYKLEIVERFITTGRLLEVGPSYGAFSFLAKQAGFEVDALEMSTVCCEFLNEQVGVRAFQSSRGVDDFADLPDYDVVAFWHVIEHLDDPLAYLKVAVEKLKPGGVLVLAAPNPESLQFKIFGKYWTHLDAPRHLCLIPSPILKEKLLSLGMILEFETWTDPWGLALNDHSWRASLKNAADGLFRQRISPTRTTNMIGRFLSWLFRGLEARDGLGNAYTVAFRKNE